MPLALKRDSATRPHGGGEGEDSSSALGSDEAGDGGMDKAMRTAIARA